MKLDGNNAIISYLSFLLIGIFTFVSVSVGKPGIEYLSFAIDLKDVVVIAVALPTMILINYVVGLLSPNEGDSGRINGKLLPMIVFVIFASIIEEMFIRSVIHVRFGVFIAAIVFALMHLKSFSYFIMTFIIGLLLGVCFEFTGSVSVPVIIHVLHNIIVVVSLNFRKNNYVVCENCS